MKIRTLLGVMLVLLSTTMLLEAVLTQTTFGVQTANAQEGGQPAVPIGFDTRDLIRWHLETDGGRAEVERMRKEHSGYRIPIHVYWAAAAGIFAAVSGFLKWL